MKPGVGAQKKNWAEENAAGKKTRRPEGKLYSTEKKILGEKSGGGGLPKGAGGVNVCAGVGEHALGSLSWCL